MDGVLNEHELRRTVVAEMHLRRWPSIVAPGSIIQLVRVVEAEERGAETAALEALPPGAVRDPGANPRHLSVSFAPGITISWERHSEASTCTLFMADLPSPLGLTSNAGGSDAERALHWVLNLPGKVIRATRIMLVPDTTAAEASLGAADFNPDELVVCDIGADGVGAVARMYSDFVLHDDGFGVVLVAANGMAPADLSRTVQRLQELGNYRNLALLGLPVAQRGWKVLDGIERQVSDLTSAIARSDLTDDALLDDITRLSIELATEAASWDYRMSATAAYAQIVTERLDELAIRRCEGFASLTDFTRRRLLPAVRTCAVHRRRSEQLAQRTSQLVSLLRTRIETRIENQNGRLLASMERNATRQLRLQQLVEGFSVVALTYYAISLLAHVLEGVEAMGWHLRAGVVIAVLTPIVGLGMWGAIHGLKKRVLGPHE